MSPAIDTSGIIVLMGIITSLREAFSFQIIIPFSPSIPIDSNFYDLQYERADSNIILVTRWDHVVCRLVSLVSERPVEDHGVMVIVV